MVQVLRRQFLIAAGAPFASPLAAQGQSPIARQRIAYLSGDSPLSNACVSDPPDRSLDALLEGLRVLGYVGEQSVALECRSAQSKYDRLDALAKELVQTKPAVIVAAAAPASLAAKRATSSIPIVSVYTADPVGLGLVKSLHQPNGNVTGLSALAADYVAKSLELLRGAAPRTSRVGVVGHRVNPTFDIYRRELEPAGRALRLALEFGAIDTLTDVGATFQALRSRGVDAFLVMHQPFTFVHREHIVNAAMKHQLPTMYGAREAVELGGLISYAASVPDVFRRAATYVDKILKGAMPASLPVEQPIKFELVINLKTAKALGLTIPQSVLVMADEVIQ